MNAFTIKDLENLSGVKAHTIRIWEQRYNFLKPQRTGTNIRYYSNEELKHILNISLLNKYGFKISHIDRMSAEEIHEKILGLSQVQAQQERLINELIQHMVDLDTEKFEQIIDDYIDARGIEKTITYIIFPFMERVGILWLTNHIIPAQEHIVTNIIRQKVIVGIDTAATHMQVNKKILLFLPEGEHHELGLLFMHYLLKSRGIKVLYIGADVPLKDIDYVVKLKKPDLVYTHLTSVAHNFNFDKFITNASLMFSKVQVIISGRVTLNYHKKVPDNFHFKRSLAEVMEYIATI